jgi:arginine/lysine/ornithine decarboxylase
MLPSLTQTAYLHIGNQSSDALKNKIEHYLHIFQSSSPSYPLMVSLEYARYFLADFTKKDLIATLKYRDLWKKQFKKAGLTIFQSDDPLKVKVSLINQSGEELAGQLEEQGVFGEKTDGTSVLLTFPLLKKETKITELFSIHITQSVKNEVPKKMKTPLLIAPFVELDLSYERQTSSTNKQISLAEAEGKIAARNITPYPPGIPLVLKGERIKVEQIKQINHYLDQNMRVTGLENQKEVVFFSEND